MDQVSAEVGGSRSKSNIQNPQDGLYVVANINGERVNCLIDTGASLTVIHPDKYFNIPEKVRPPLEPINSNLRMADGGRIPAMGKTSLALDFGQGVVVEQSMVVADVEAPLVLGYDFQYSNSCLVDVRQSCISINGKKFNCLLESRMNSIFRITVSETAGLN